MTQRVILTEDRAIDQLRCCRDHCSIEGLATLRRCFPRRWHRIIHSQCWDEIDTSTTLGLYLEEGAGRLLAPRGVRDQSLKKKRCSARRLREAFGDMVIASIRERDLQRIRRDYEAIQDLDLNAALIQADMSLLRRVVVHGQEALGDVRVRRRWDARRRGAGRSPKPRPVVTPREVRRLLMASDRKLAAAIALTVGCGLLPRELKRRRAGSLSMPEQAVLVRHRGVRGWGQVTTQRVIRVPFWAWQLVKRAWPELARMSKDALLFPSPRDPSKPWDSFGRALRRAAVRAGLQEEGEKDPRWTPTGLRRLYQELSAKAGVARALVRGTAVEARGSEAMQRQWSLAESDKLASEWVYLLQPPGYEEDGLHHVPRRAPSGVHPAQPEWPNRRVKAWLEERVAEREAEREDRLPSGCDEVPVVVARPRRRDWAADEAAIERMVAAQRREVEEAQRRAEKEDAFAAGALVGGVGGVLLGRKLRDLEG